MFGGLAGVEGCWVAAAVDGVVVFGEVDVYVEVVVGEDGLGCEVGWRRFGWGCVGFGEFDTVGEGGGEGPGGVEGGDVFAGAQGAVCVLEEGAECRGHRSQESRIIDSLRSVTDTWRVG